MLIYWNKRKYLHKKRVQLPQDFLGTPTWPPFHCFGTPIWRPRRHVKTLYYNLDLVCKQKQLSRSANYRDLPEMGFWVASTNPPITMERERWKQVKTYLKPLVGIILFRSPAVFTWKQVKSRSAWMIVFTIVARSCEGSIRNSSVLHSHRH